LRAGTYKLRMGTVRYAAGKGPDGPFGHLIMMRRSIMARIRTTGECPAGQMSYEAEPSFWERDK